MSRKDSCRTSSYLNCVDLPNGSSLLYNGFTSCMDLVPTGFARELLDDNGRKALSSLTPDEMTHLLNRGHLTALTVRGEQEKFRRFVEHVLRVRGEARTGTDGRRAVAFILTYRCNLSCTYCYQSALRQRQTPSAMDGQFVDEFFRLYLKKLFPRCPKKNISLLLFGGEPLLSGNREAIEKILRHAKRFNAPVATATNAVLLPHMLDLMGPEAGRIQRVQVTLDGGRAFHDKVRVGPSGTPTFEEIIRSIRALMKAGVHTSIRVHLHLDGLSFTRELVDYLEREGILGHQYINLYFAPLNSFERENAPSDYFDSISGLFMRVASLQKSPPSSFTHGLTSIMEAETPGSGLRLRYCTAGSGLLRVVDSRGDLYDCYEEAGDRFRRIGRLADGQVMYFKREAAYERRHLLNLPQCLRCSIACYCGGGCLSQARIRNGSIFEPYCQQHKELVAQTLKASFLLHRAPDAGASAKPSA